MLINTSVPSPSISHAHSSMSPQLSYPRRNVLSVLAVNTWVRTRIQGIGCRILPTTSALKMSTAQDTRYYPVRDLTHNYPPRHRSSHEIRARSAATSHCILRGREPHTFPSDTIPRPEALPTFAILKEATLKTDLLPRPLSGGSA